MRYKWRLAITPPNEDIRIRQNHPCEWVAVVVRPRRSILDKPGHVGPLAEEIIGSGTDERSCLFDAVRMLLNHDGYSLL